MRRSLWAGCRRSKVRKKTLEKGKDTADALRQVIELLELADENALDLLRSRAAEQEVLDLLDEPPTR